MTVTAYDAYGNVETDYVGPATLSASTGDGTVSPASIDFVNGVAAPDVTLTKADDDVSLVVSDGLVSSDSDSPISVSPAAADAGSSMLAPTSSSITADGTSTQNVTVQAEDAYGNDLTTGGATVTITQLSGTGTIGLVVDNGDGTYTATVTAPTTTGSGVFVATLNGDPVQNGTASQAQATVNYVPGPLDHFGFATDGGTQTAGSPFTVTVTAYDAYGNVETDYVGPATLSASTGDGTVSPASIDFVNGVAAPDVTLTKADDDVSLVVSDGLVSSDSDSPISVSPAAADAGSAMLAPTSSSITADGTSTQNVTVQAEDAYGNDLTTGGATVTITQLSGTGTIGLVVDNGDGTYTATVTAPTTTGSGVFVATLNGDPVQNGTASQAQATVNYVPGPLAKFAISIASTQADGVALTGTDTVTAQDAYGNTVTGYDASADHVMITASPNNGTISGLGSLGGNVLDRALDFTNGVANLTGKLVFGGIAGSHTFTATSAIGPYTGTSGTVTVNPGSATTLVLSGLSTQTAGTAQSLTVTAQDAYGNTATGYTGTVHFTSSDGSATLPANYTFLAGDAGVHSFSSGVTLKTAGSRSVTGTDTVTGTITAPDRHGQPGSATALTIETAANGYRHSDRHQGRDRRQQLHRLRHHARHLR